MAFKRRKQKEKVIKKTITILDAETKKVEDVIDIIEPEVEEIVLNDTGGGMIPALTDMEMEDMSIMKGLHDMYPKMEDMKTFVNDACAAHKQTLDSSNPDLTDAEIAANKVIADAAIEAEKVRVAALVDPKNQKDLNDKAIIEANKVAAARETSIVEAEKLRHEAAQKRE